MIFVLCGPGGVGKGTVASRLVQQIDTLELSRSWTTRQLRVGESPFSYVFVAPDEFQTAITAGRFIEWAEFLGNLYGTPVPDPSVLTCDHHLLLEIDVQGAQQIVQRYLNAVLFVLLPPSDQELKNRLRQRGDSESHVRARAELAKNEIAKANLLGAIPIVNADLDKTLDEIIDVILERVRRCNETMEK